MCTTSACPALAGSQRLRHENLLLLLQHEPVSNRAIASALQQLKYIAGHNGYSSLAGKTNQITTKSMKIQQYKLVYKSSTAKVYSDIAVSWCSISSQEWQEQWLCQWEQRSAQLRQPLLESASDRGAKCGLLCIAAHREAMAGSCLNSGFFAKQGAPLLLSMCKAGMPLNALDGCE